MRDTDNMTNTFYHIDVESAAGENEANDGAVYASAFGDLETISYISKKVAKEIESTQGTISILLSEVDRIGGNAEREVLRIVADADIVRDVLKSRLTSERKASKNSVPSEPASNVHGLNNETAVEDSNGDMNLSSEPSFSH